MHSSFWLIHHTISFLLCSRPITLKCLIPSISSLKIFLMAENEIYFRRGPQDAKKNVHPIVIKLLGALNP